MEISTRKMLYDEMKYAAEQSYQLMAQTGFIGAMKNGLWEDGLKNSFTDEIKEGLDKALSLFSKSHYNYRADIDGYSFLVLALPNNDVLVPHCYCYRKAQLDKHMEEAKNGIRFITSDYKEKFRLPDGGKISIIYGYNGECVERVCRYLDETHFEVGLGKYGANVYHIGEFAGIMEKNGNRCEPVKGTPLFKNNSNEER